MFAFYLSCSQNFVVLKGDVEQYTYGCFVFWVFFSVEGWSFWYPAKDFHH